MTKSSNGAITLSIGIKAYLIIWSISLLLLLLDDTFIGNGAGGLDARPLVKEDHQYLFPVVCCLLGSIYVSASTRLTMGLACLGHLVDLMIRWKRMPTVWDHEQWAMQIELTFFLVFLPKCFTSLSSWNQSETAFFAICRYQFVLFYAAATFWKLNSGFFDTDVSCGTVLILETLTTYLPEGFFSPAITMALGNYSPHKTVLMEGAIAITMALHSTRRVAVMFASVFHLIIFLLPVNMAGGFSMDCATRFIVFFTSSELQHYLSQASIARESIFAAATSVSLALLRYSCTGTPMDFGFTGMCLLFAFYMRVVLTNADFPIPKANSAFSSSFHRFVLLLQLILASTYGFLTVILGVQHMGAPTMYSNLRYYGGGNHFLVPVSIMPDNLIYGGGLVQILESTSASLNQRLAYMASEDVFPATTLEKIRIATNQTTLPIQFFPLCISNPHLRVLLASEYEPSNPVGSTNFMPFILPISEFRKALAEEAVQGGSYVVKFVDAGTSDSLQDTAGTPERVIVLTRDVCEIQSAFGEKVDECAGDRAAQFIMEPSVETGWITWLVSKLQTPYPQLVGLKEEICMS